MGIFGFGKKKDLQKESGKQLVRKYKRVVLVILDGFGIDKNPEGNAILQARTPFLDSVWNNCPKTLLNASGTFVGLPEGEPGNSEVGHLTIGTGRIHYQSLPMINDEILSGRFALAPKLQESFNNYLESRKKYPNAKFHILGILSAGGVHGHITHLFALLDLCKEYDVDPYIHAFLDGRDTSRDDGGFYLQKLQNKLQQIGIGKIASISGRVYAMDRDNKWPRIEKAFNAMIGATNSQIKSSKLQDFITQKYSEKIYDQYMTPTALTDDNGGLVGPIRDGDTLFLYNFREDRIKQLSKVLTEPTFAHFPLQISVSNIHYTTMTGFETNPRRHVVYPNSKTEDNLAALVAHNNIPQFHIAETEKYAHVSYFFNGRVGELNNMEQHFQIDSPSVQNYAESPEMSAEQVVSKFCELFSTGNYEFAVVNLCNADMLGHTGDLEQTSKSINILDAQLRKLTECVLAQDGAVFITADHGNCEVMVDRVSGEVNTFHTTNPVPLIKIDSPTQLINKNPDLRIGSGEVPIAGILADIAPTLLNQLGVAKPRSMNGVDISDVIG